MKLSKQSQTLYNLLGSLSTTQSRGTVIFFSRYQNKMSQQALPICRVLYIHSKNPKMLLMGWDFFPKFSYILPIHERKITLIFII